MRCVLIAENKALEEDELRNINEDEKQRIEDAAKLGGLPIQEAYERRKGFRYLY